MEFRDAFFVFLVVVLVGCQQAQVDDSLGCQKSEVAGTGCDLADEGNQNIDLFTDLASVSVSASDVEYVEDVTGYLAQPSEEGVYPGIIMIHEWWGLNENIKDMARLLADEGYVVLAVDLYEGNVATDSGDARKYSGAVRNDSAKANANMQGAASYLRGMSFVDASKLGSMGWCFGGGQSLQLALSGEELAATVIYYGNLESDPSLLSVIDQPILGVFGEKDTSISLDSVHVFNDALDDLGIENEIYIYEGVGHAFANPSGSRYAATETLDAWEKTTAFLDAHLKS